MNNSTETRPVIVIGAGGHAKVMIDILKLCDAHILGIVENKSDLVKIDILGVNVLCTDGELLQKFPPKMVNLINGIGSIRDNKLREAIFDKFKKIGYSFSQVIHPAAIISKHAVLGEGVQVIARAIINPGTSIADNSIINTKVSVDHDCHIGRHVHLAPGVTVCGHVIIGEGAFIGAGATIIQGITIGEYSLIAAGALVRKDVPAGATVMGVPGIIRRS